MQDFPLSIIQARRSSERFPDKVFARLGDKTVIQHVLDNTPDPKVLAVPLEENWPDLDVPMLKGDMRPTVRFKQALAAYPCKYFFRVCADSPFIRPAMFRALIDARGKSLSIRLEGVIGWNLQLCNTNLFLACCKDDDEHVLSHIRLWDFVAPNFCVDYPEDIARLEKWL